MQFNPNIPIYLQIMEDIKKSIVTGSLAQGERVESVRALADKYEVNLNTMQRACSELERQQVINTQRGVGSFVTGDEKIIIRLKNEMSDRLIQSFTREMKEIGYTPQEILTLVKKEMDQ